MYISRGYPTYRQQIIIATDSQGNKATTTFTILPPPPPTNLEIIPVSSHIVRRDEFNTQIWLSDARNLAAAQIRLSFDPYILEVLEIGTGTFPTNALISKNFDNTSGNIYYFAGLLTGSATGSGILFSIKFKAKQTGTSAVSFLDNTTLVNANNQSIPFTKKEAIFYVLSSLTISPQNATLSVGNTLSYSAYAQCGPSQIDVTNLTTFTAYGGGSFTTNIFKAYYIGTYTIQAQYLSLVATTSVHILPGTPTTLLYVSGTNQIATCTTTLPQPLVVKVEDSYGNPVNGIHVLFKVASAPPGAEGFYFSATVTTTNQAGLASTYFTLGSEPAGSYTIHATSAGLTGSPVVFSAYALRRFGNIAGVCLIDTGTSTQKKAGITVKIVQISTTTTTNSDSYFIFKNIPVGTYTLTFDYVGATPATKTSVVISPTQLNNTYLHWDNNSNFW